MFFDHDQIEFEVFHSLKWPRLRLNSTNDIISIAMAKRIIFLFVSTESCEQVAGMFCKEWDREIDPEAIEDVLNRNFELTDLDVPSGETLIWTHDPPSTHYEVVPGKIIPSGIFHDVVDIRSQHSDFIADRIYMQYGFILRDKDVDEIIERWTETLPTDNHGRFIEPVGTSRMPHPGRHLQSLPTHISEAQDTRVAFAVPPPAYSPRPVYRGLVLRHPREVNDIQGHHPPFFPASWTPNPPDYSPGASPPMYGSRSNAPGVPVQTDSRQAAARTTETDEETSTLPTSPARANPAGVPEQKQAYWPPCPAPPIDKYTLDDILDYLFAHFPNNNSGPYIGDLELEQFEPRDSRRIRDILSSASQQRLFSHVQVWQVFRDVNTRESTPLDQIDLSMGPTVRALLEEFRRNSELRLTYQEDQSPVWNAHSLAQALRQSNSAPLRPVPVSAEMTAEILVALQKMDDPHVVDRLEMRYGNMRLRFADFDYFVANLAARRIFDTLQTFQARRSANSLAIPSVTPFGPRFIALITGAVSGLFEPSRVRSNRNDRLYEGFREWYDNLAAFPFADLPATMDETVFAEHAIEPMVAFHDTFRQWATDNSHYWPLWKTRDQLAKNLVKAEANLFHNIHSHGVESHPSVVAWLTAWDRGFVADIRLFTDTYLGLRHGLIFLQELPSLDSVAPSVLFMAPLDEVYREMNTCIDQIGRDQWEHNLLSMTGMQSIPFIRLRCRLRVALLEVYSYTLTLRTPWDTARTDTIGNIPTAFDSEEAADMTDEPPVVCEGIEPADVISLYQAFQPPPAANDFQQLHNPSLPTQPFGHGSAHSVDDIVMTDAIHPAPGPSSAISSTLGSAVLGPRRRTSSLSDDQQQRRNFSTVAEFSIYVDVDFTSNSTPSVTMADSPPTSPPQLSGILTETTSEQDQLAELADRISEELTAADVARRP